jgi:DNA repair exonuclease SbcCD ATPase subunit
MQDSNNDLEEEIRVELEKLEQIFNEESQLESLNPLAASLKPNRVSYSAYEYAEAEGEKEELEDKLNQLLSKADDWKSQIDYVTRLNAGLQAENVRLAHENAAWRQSAPAAVAGSEITSTTEVAHGKGTMLEPHGVYECFGSLSQGSIALELLLAEARARAANAEAALRDTVTIKDAALQELQKERLLRIHVGKRPSLYEFCANPSPPLLPIPFWPFPWLLAEKERDAYSAAYEASLQHFDKWSRAARSKS